MGVFIDFLREEDINLVAVRTNDGFVTIESGVVNNNKPKGW